MDYALILGLGDSLDVEKHVGLLVEHRADVADRHR